MQRSPDRVIVRYGEIFLQDDERDYDPSNPDDARTIVKCFRKPNYAEGMLQNTLGPLEQEAMAKQEAMASRIGRLLSLLPVDGLQKIFNDTDIENLLLASKQNERVKALKEKISRLPKEPDTKSKKGPDGTPNKEAFRPAQRSSKKHKGRQP